MIGLKLRVSLHWFVTECHVFSFSQMPAGERIHATRECDRIRKRGRRPANAKGDKTLENGAIL